MTDKNISYDRFARFVRKQHIIKIHDYKCYFCGREIDPEKEDYWDIHHINPIASGGSLTVSSNLAPAHQKCHVKYHKKRNVEQYKKLMFDKKVRNS